MKRIIVLLLITALISTSMATMIYEVEAADTYIVPASQITDINNHWAEQYIYTLVNYGILSGYGDNTFKPDNQITRSEYIAALFKTVCILDESIQSIEDEGIMYDFYFYGYREAERRNFLETFKTLEYDTPYQDLENHWSKNIVAWVKNYADKKYPGLFTKVFAGSEFYPDRPITREEAAVVTVAFSAPAVRTRNIQFQDISPDYKFKEEITTLVDNEIINGFPDGTFKLEENITRASAAVIMTNVLKEIAYNMDFFSNMDHYMTFIGSTADSDYIPSFMSEELYENPPTEADKKYVSYFKAYMLDRSLVQELMSSYFIVESKGLEPGSAEYEKALEELENEIIEKYEKMKREEIPYYHEEEERVNVLKELEQQDYWNKAGLYYWLYRYDENQPIEYLEKAEQSYDISKNGKDDLYALYKAFIDYYSTKEKDAQKVVDYTSKLEELFVPNEYGEARLASVELERFYLFAAFDLVKVEEYSKALDYVDKFIENTEGGFLEHLALEKGALMYMTGQADEAVEYLTENLIKLEQEEYVDEYLKDRYIWAIKTIMRQK